MSNELKGTIYVLLCVALWALIPVVAKLGQSNLDHHQFLFWSSLVSFLVIFMTVLLSKKIKHLKQYSKFEWVWYSFLGLLGTYVYYLFLYLGYKQAKGMEVLVIQYTWPILIVVFSVIILKEKVNFRKIFAILFGFCGVILVMTKGEFEQISIDNPTVLTLVGTGAACFAIFSVLSKRIDKEPLGVVMVYFFVASMASMISMLFYSEFTFPSENDLLPILLNGVFVNGFSYVFWVLALRSCDATYLAPFTFITPILSAIYLILFFEEPFIPVYIFGLLMVVFGGVLNSFTSKNTS